MNRSRCQLGREGYGSDSDADRILSDAEDFGRRQPWVVLAGAAAVGLAAARFLKASSRERYRSQHDTRQLGSGPTAGADAGASKPASRQPNTATQRSQGATAEPAGV